MINYEAKLILELADFFVLKEADELQSQALNQLALVSEQSSVTLRELVQEQKVAKIDFLMEDITVRIPFKAFNAKYTGDTDVERAWNFKLSGLKMNQLPSKKIEDLY